MSNKVKKIVLAYSGGLDTSYCAHWLSSQDNTEVHAVAVNTGGFDQEQIAEMKTKALAFGVAQFECINAEEELYNSILKYLIFGNVLRNNTYPLSVSAERVVQAIALINYANSIEAEAIAHGSTGAGNDQIRFDLIFQTLGNSIEIITPIRDQKLSRETEIEYLKSHGYEYSWEKSKYSINQGLWGTSVGGAETLTSDKTLPEEAYPSQLEENQSKNLTLDFKQGELVGIDGENYAPVEAIKELQKIAKKYAIGRDIHVGDTIIGIKGRVGFEAAAPMIIIKAHELLEKHTLSKWQLFQKQQLAQFYGMMAHEGLFLDEVMRNTEVYMQDCQRFVTGKVFVALHPYRFELIGIESRYDQMKSSAAQYGEMNNSWTADDAKGFIKIYANGLKNAKSVQDEN
jgi:argininosuccinate synthase